MHLELALQGLDKIAVEHLSEEKKSFWRKKLEDVYNSAKTVGHALYKEAAKDIKAIKNKAAKTTTDVKRAIAAGKEELARAREERRKAKEKGRQTTPAAPPPGVDKEADIEPEEDAMPKMHGRAAANVYFTDLPLAGRNEWDGGTST